MKKKLLFVINSLGIGGAEKSLVSLMNTIDFDRYEIDLLMLQPGGPFLRLLPEEVHILPQLEFLESNNSIRSQLMHPKYLAARVAASAGLRINRRRKTLHPAQCYWKYAGYAFNPLPEYYDAAIAWGQGNPTHYVAVKVKAHEKIAVINANYEAAGHNRKFDMSYYAHYSYIVNVSDQLCAITQKVFPEYADRMITIYDINNARVIEDMSDEGNPFEQGGHVLKLVTVGRVSREKGYDLAVQTAIILKNRGIHFQWVFVGDGPEFAVIKSMISKAHLEDMIVLAGSQTNPYIYMKHADIYVQTSRFEGFCLTIGEARILNIPIVSTDFDVVRNQIKDGRNGLITEMDPESIANAIIRLSRDNALRNKIVSELKKEKKGNLEEIEKWYQIFEG